MEKKVLTLAVSKQWFDMIESGEKTEEYREIKEYWISRLFEMPKELTCIVPFIPLMVKFHFLNIKKLLEYVVPFTHVLFINGYGDDKPRIKKEIESITIGKPQKGWCPYEFLDKEYFVIKFK